MFLSLFVVYMSIGLGMYLYEFALAVVINKNSTTLSQEIAGMVVGMMFWPGIFFLTPEILKRMKER